MLSYLRKKDKLEFILILILLTQGIINLVGALGPELAFDALWYHLTIPKLYIQEGEIFFIPGTLLYYSAMPKLIEMLYIPALALGSEVFAKLIHFSFGILTLFVLYKLSRIFFSRNSSLLVLVVFYSNLVVAWQSITAYIDLGRTLFEVLALFFIVKFFGVLPLRTPTRRPPSFHSLRALVGGPPLRVTPPDKLLFASSISLGLAISSKLMAFFSLLVFVLILLLRRIEFPKIIKFAFIVIIIPSPWFIFSYIHTGNPIYPFFTEIYRVGPSVSISNILNFVRSPDPISPIYLIVLPLVIVTYKKFDNLLKVVAIYSFLSFLIWFVTPQTGGGRFIMPYLPAFSILAVSAVNYSKNIFIKKYLIALIILISVSTLIYRGAANAKYVPVIIGLESKHQFLAQNLNYDFGDFYDVDDYFKNNIGPNDKVLIYGGHNLFYVNFPFIHESWVKPDDKFNYVMTQGVDLPERFSDWSLVYENITTHVKLYRKP